MKRALILGVTGQDGSYLADILIEKGYQVHGTYRRSSTGNLKNVNHSIANGGLILHRADMCDPLSIRNVIASVSPQEIYNEADQDSVGWSNSIPDYNMDITAAAVGRLLEAVCQVNKQIRVFQPCTAMMFGDAAFLSEETDEPQNESTRFNPQSPYACAKVCAYYLCRHYREQHGVQVSTGILYNHDSPRRTEEYLLHKICRSVQRISNHTQDVLRLGNLDAMVEIGYAREYMEAAWTMLQHPPGDFVIGTGKVHTVGEWANMAFDQVGLSSYGKIGIDKEFYRESPKRVLRADISKASKVLNWRAKTTGPALIREIMGAV